MSVKIIIGDVREQIKQLPDESINCIVTSPPYYGLRDYGVSSQIGMETTPWDYVDQLVSVFRLARRALRDDGTLWLNLGDSYAGSGKGGNPVAGKQATNKGSQFVGNLYQIGKTSRENAVTNVTRKTFDGIKAKDLIGIPWRVAFALQADGWWLRQDIIWSKPNPMPESVGDRCTRAHEYIFMLSKSARYFYDASAIAEPAIYFGLTGQDQNGFKNPLRFNGKLAKSDKQRGHGMRNKRDVWEVATKPFPEAHFATFPPDLIEPCVKAGCPEGGTILDPFGGAGTTGLVADRLKRNAILFELNPEYAAIAERRIKGDAPMFTEVELS